MEDRMNKNIDNSNRREPELEEPEIRPPQQVAWWPGERVFAAELKYWFLVLVLWFLGWITLVISLQKFSAVITISYIVLFIVWLVTTTPQTVKEKERAKPIFLGMIEKKVSFGAVLVLRPFEKLIRYPTDIQQITLAPAGIQTKQGTDPQGRPLPTITLPVTAVVNFRWPSKDNDLTECIKNAPSPDDIEALQNIIEEPILDVIRTVGGTEGDYLWISQQRTIFAEKVNKMILKKKAIAHLIRLARLRDFTVSFKHIDPPDELKKQQVAEAAAHYKGEAAKIEIIKQGEGTARAEAIVREAILDVLTAEKYKEIAMRVEGMRTLTQTAQGSKSTYVIPAELVTSVGAALGGPEKVGMSKEQLRQFIVPILTQIIEEQLKKKGG